MFTKVLKASPSYILPSLLNLAALMVYTRFLAVEEFGIYSISILTIELSQAALYQWNKMALIRFYHQKDWQSTDIVKTCVVSNISISLIVGLLLILGITLAKLESTYGILIFAIAINVVVRGWGYFFAEYFRIAYTGLGKYTLYSVFFSVAAIAPGLAFTLISNNTVDVSTILFLNGSVLAIFVVLILLLLRRVLFSGRFRRSVFRATLSYGYPLIVVLLATSLGTRSDRFLIEKICGLEELAYYSAAYSLSNMIISSIVMVLTIPTYPQIMRLVGEGSIESAKSLYKKNGELIFFLCIPLVVLGIVESQRICQIIIGDAIGNEAASLLPYVLIFVFFLNIKQHFFDQALQFSSKTKYAISISIPAGILHFCLGWLSIKEFGAYGMAISGIFAYTLSIFVIKVLTNKVFRIEIDFLQLIKTVLTAIVAMYVIKLITLDVNFVVALLTNCILYAMVFLAVTFIVNKSAINLLRS